MKENIVKNLHAACPWVDTLHWHYETESTNTDAKRLARAGAPQGTVILAGRQTGGRGRMGRTFLSPEGTGIYLSLILRPEEKAARLQHLTCAVAVAVCDAIEVSCGFRPRVKWINDLVWKGKKLGGILTELSLAADGSVAYAIVGIGLNVSAVPEGVADMADCLCSAAGKTLDPAKIAAALIEALWRMDLSRKASLMDRYRADCLTLGREVVLLRGDEKLYGKALALTDDGSLTVQLADGTTITAASGEVSVRGMYGYL